MGPYLQAQRIHRSGGWTLWLFFVLLAVSILAFVLSVVFDAEHGGEEDQLFSKTEISYDVEQQS